MATQKFTDRVSATYSLNKHQASLDFIDVPIGGDLAVFLDPSRIRNIGTPWALDCVSLLQDYFTTLLNCVKNNNKPDGLRVLKGLSEGNEFHLGLSKNKSQGSGIGEKFANDLWGTLKKSKASATGLLNDLEDACLFIEGVADDRISDACCNILRGPLITYTQNMCHFYGIPMSHSIKQPVWNKSSKSWDQRNFDLPVTNFGPIIFVPKIAVRSRITYNSSNYELRFLVPAMQSHELSLNSNLVETLKNGNIRVTKKAILNHYGRGKYNIAERAALYPPALEKYKSNALKIAVPISNQTLAEIQNTDVPNFENMLANLVNAPGEISDFEYERLIGDFLNCIFYPAFSCLEKLDKKMTQVEHFSIVYSNNFHDTLFNLESIQHQSKCIFVECQNATLGADSPMFDRFGAILKELKGSVGILVCRDIEDKSDFINKSKNHANNNNQFIVCLTHADLSLMAKDLSHSFDEPNYSSLKLKFSLLI